MNDHPFSRRDLASAAGAAAAGIAFVNHAVADDKTPGTQVGVGEELVKACNRPTKSHKMAMTFRKMAWTLWKMIVTVQESSFFVVSIPVYGLSSMFCGLGMSFCNSMRYFSDWRRYLLAWQMYFLEWNRALK